MVKGRNNNIRVVAEACGWYMINCFEYDNRIYLLFDDFLIMVIDKSVNNRVNEEK
jgi:hypothetical protein